MNENIVTGKKYRILKDEVGKIWDRISFWTKASDVELNSGTTVESAISTINTNISNINTAISNRTVDPKSHASSDTKYGVASTSNYGHVRLWNDIYNSPSSSSGYAEAGGSVNDLRVLVNGALDGKAPTKHDSTATTHGVGSASRYGHVKISDNFNDYTVAADGVAASTAAVRTVNNGFSTYLKANSTDYFYFDYQNGKYGYNTSSDRRASTFHPFKSGSSTVGTFNMELTHRKGNTGDGGSVAVSQIKVSGDGTFSLTKSIISDDIIDKDTLNPLTKDIAVEFYVTKNSSSTKVLNYSRDSSTGYSVNVSGKSFTYSDGDLLTITATVSKPTLYHMYAKFEYKLTES